MKSHLELQINKKFNPNIIKTIAIQDSGIESLYEEIVLHHLYLEKNKIKLDKKNQRYREQVQSFFLKTLNEKHWDNEKEILLKNELNKKNENRISPQELVKSFFDE